MKRGSGSKESAVGREFDGRGASVPPGPGQRWTVARKREVVLRLLRGESLEAVLPRVGR